MSAVKIFAFLEIEQKYLIYDLEIQFRAIIKIKLNDWAIKNA
jgi:hypothetical protein